MTDREKTPAGFEALFLGGLGLAVSVAGYFLDAPVKVAYVIGLGVSSLFLGGGLISRSRARKKEEEQRRGEEALARRAAAKPTTTRSESVADKRHLLLVCTYCLDHPKDDNEYASADWSVEPTDPRLKQNPARFMCRHCAGVMTFDPKKISSVLGYTKEAEDCSPDRSGIAFFFEGEHHENHALWRISTRLREDRKRPVPAPPPNPHQRESDIATRLREWQEERDRVRATLTGIALRDYDKVMDRKRIAILEGEGE